jgi:hypothetical protein
MSVSLYDSGRRGIVCAFPSIPRRESAQSKVFAFETPVESLIKIMENAEIARRLEQVTGLLEAQRANPSGSRRTTAPQWVLGILISIWPISGASRAQGRRSWRPNVDFALLESVPGIGCVPAERLHGEFGIDSLEVGANDRRLGDPWESKKLIGVTSSAVRGSGITMHQPHRFLKFRIA